MVNRISNTLFGLATCALLASSIAVSAQSRPAVRPGSAGTFVTFDIPGAGTHANQGTIPVTLNPSGTVTGRYLDNTNTYHGFLITLAGNIETFDVPGPQHGTLGYGISPDGTIVGFYFDTHDVPHGFLRAPDGSFLDRDLPPLHNINASKWTSGFFDDANKVRHGVIRSPEPEGMVTMFDVLGAGTASGQGTFVCPGCLNDYGVIPGRWVDGNNVAHGYVRSFLGDITKFDIPGAVGTGTWIAGINNRGQAIGYWIDANNVAHAFIRDSNTGGLTPFDAPGAGTGSGQGTFGENINNHGVAFGYYVDSANVSHGFLRSVRGTFTILDAPGAGTVRGGTQGGANIDSGLVTGNYIDNNLVNHGYLWFSALP